MSTPANLSKADLQEHLVIGGGVIGLCVGYFLARDGHSVVIIDRDVEQKETCSNRNAGMVVPSHFIPLAAPGVVTQGLKWMLDPSSPFYLRPRFDLSLWKWCWQFVRHANRRHVENCQELLRDLSLESRALFVELSEELEFEFVKKGLLMLCQSEEGLEEEAEVAKAANALGIVAEVCDPARLRELDPDVEMNALGGVWFAQDGHLNSEKFLAALRRGIAKHGGRFVADEVTGFRKTGESISAVSTRESGEIAAGQIILAGGAWTPELARELSLNLPMQGGKGYSFTLANPTQLPQLCSLLKEGRVAVTPMDQTLRVAGTMEICGEDLSIDPRRLRGIVDSFCRFFPAFSPDHFEGLKPWAGLRPCSPDGMPYVGRAPGWENVLVATGHSMLGLSLGPVTGRRIAEIVAGASSDDRLEPARFS
ncbi:MAG: FAD-dependent oxidoreductase [Verrucomicrobiales bacterium]|nr:FAD-dependent oxidoreductase [Verrucomicrobiales bacterium]